MNEADIQLEQYIIKFIRAIRLSCSYAAAVPVAYALMFAEPGPEGITVFKVDANVVKSMLPKGGEEVRQFLYEALDKWVKENYPDEIDPKYCSTDESRSVH